MKPQRTIVLAFLLAISVGTLVYSCDKPEIAAVDENGKVTGIARGSATVTVRNESDGGEAYVKISVLG